MAKMPNYLQRRGAVYQFRMPVPKDLHEALGKEVIRHSLNTKEHDEAKAMVLQLAAQWGATFAEARAAKHLTPEDLDRAAWEHYERELKIDERERQTIPAQGEVETVIAAEVQEFKSSRNLGLRRRRLI